MLCPHLKPHCFVPLFRATVIFNYLRYAENKYLIIFFVCRCRCLLNGCLCKKRLNNYNISKTTSDNDIIKHTCIDFDVINIII